jgi:hypothetical protein
MGLADSTTTATLLFAIASKDSARSWLTALTNLPADLCCRDLRWVKDPGGSHVYLVTFGRSLWVADQETDR